MIFKNIFIGDFGGSVVQEKDKERKDLIITKFWIPVDAHYEHFDLGTNCCKIFTFSGVFFNDSDNIKKYTIS